MFYWAVVSWVVVFLVVALIAAVLGFTAIAGTAVNIAWILFVVGLILVVVLTGLAGRRRGYGRGLPMPLARRVSLKSRLGCLFWLPPLALATVITSGCAAVALTAGGVTAAVGVNHTLNGIVYKTFAEPLPKVKRATLTALKQMEIPVETVEKTKQGEVIKAKAANRAIEVGFEALTPKTTRMRVVADSDGLVKDSATATEIILQTERALPAT
jgi:uncharacterized membrane protein YtjA (UPF0391 family)